MALTDKQLAFCREYIIDLNLTQAAIRAGYSEDTAGSIGSENLKKPEIKEKVQEYMDLRAKRTEITADRVLVELSKLGFADVREIFGASGGLIEPSEMNDDISAAIQQIEVVTKINGEEDERGNKIPEYIHKIRLADKKGALELMGKHLKLFTDKVEHTGKDGKDLAILPPLSATEIDSLRNELDEEC